MPAPFSLDLYREDLIRIVECVFQTMMGLEANAGGESWTGASDTVTAAVHFVGEWKGAALIECRRQQALLFAGRFLGIGEAADLDDDVRDVIGELANMVAGNLKSLLPKGVELSMPSVVEGRDYAMYLCGVTAAECIRFTTEAGDFRVSVAEMMSPAA